MAKFYVCTMLRPIDLYATVQFSTQEQNETREYCICACQKSRSNGSITLIITFLHQWVQSGVLTRVTTSDDHRKFEFWPRLHCDYIKFQCDRDFGAMMRYFHISFALVTFYTL